MNIFNDMFKYTINTKNDAEKYICILKFKYRITFEMQHFNQAFFVEF